eukprot:scaffold315758_cov46-Prasinocladus_malaysianus.AAC.1
MTHEIFLSLDVREQSWTGSVMTVRLPKMQNFEPNGHTVQTQTKRRVVSKPRTLHSIIYSGLSPSHHFRSSARNCRTKSDPPLPGVLLDA